MSGTIAHTLLEATRAHSTELLIEALSMLPSMKDASAAERMTHHTICTVIEERIPAVEPRMVAWSELEWGVDLTYAEALLASIAEVTA